jgi:hypothetical protein
MAAGRAGRKAMVDAVAVRLAGEDEEAFLRVRGGAGQCGGDQCYDCEAHKTPWRRKARDPGCKGECKDAPAE